MRNPFEIKTSLHQTKTAKTLDWEESAVDSSSLVNELYDSERVSPPLGWLRFFLLLIFGIFISRIFFLQVINGAHFRMMSDNNRANHSRMHYLLF
jgi:hypothetical protein